MCKQFSYFLHFLANIHIAYILNLFLFNRKDDKENVCSKMSYLWSEKSEATGMSYLVLFFTVTQ